MMTGIFWLIDTVLGIVYFLLIANIIASWLMAFNVINSHQPFIRSLLSFLHQICEPIVRPIRRFVPNFNGIDLSSLIAILLVHFLRILIAYDIKPMLMG